MNKTLRTLDSTETPVSAVNSFLVVGLMLLMLGLFARPVCGAERTWISTPADGFWSNPANWDGGLTAPAANDTLVFTNSSITSTTNDVLAANANVNSITFRSGGDAFTLWGTGITLNGNITNSSANSQVINLDTLVNFDRMLVGATNLTLGGLTLNNGGNRTLYSRLTGGTLFMNNITLSEAPATARTFTIAGGASGPAAQANTTISGVVANGSTAGSSLTYFGTGTLKFNGAAPSTYTAASTVIAGTLLLDFANLASGVNLLDPASTLTLGGGAYRILGRSSGATFQTNGNLTLTANTGSGITLDNNGGSGTTLRLGNLGGRGGNSTLFIDTSAGGTLSVGTTPAVANGILNPAFAAIRDATGTGFATVSGNAIVRYASATPLVDTANDPTVNYSYAANGTTFNWNNGITSRGANSLAIDTTANSGVLDLGGAANVLTNSSRAILMTGGNNFTIQNGQVGSAGVEQIVHVAGQGVLTISGSVGSGAASLTKGGSGTLILSGANTYSGVTAVTEGTLKQGGSNSLGTTNGTLAVSAGGTMDLNGFNLSVGQINGNGGGIILNNGASAATLMIGSGNVASSGTTTFTIADGANPLALLKVGTGRVQLSGASSFTGGTTITAGDLRVNHSQGLGDGPVTLNGGGIFTPSANPMPGGLGQVLPNNFVIVGDSGNNFLQIDITGFTWSGDFSGSGSVKLHAGTRTGFNANFPGDLSAFTGTFNVAHAAPSSTFQARLTRAGSASTKFSLSTAGSQLSFTSGTLTGVSLGELSGVAGTTLTIAGTNKIVTVGALNTSSTFGGVISDGSASVPTFLTKVGAGVLTLGSAATYTGETVVSNGLLFVSGLSSTNVLVYAPGAFGGSGLLVSPVILSSGNAGLLLTNGVTGTLFVGNGTTGLTLGSGNRLAFDVGANPTADSISVTGPFSQTGTATVYISQAAGFGAGTFTLISGATGISAANFTLGNTIPGYSLALSDDTANLILTVTVSAPPVAFWKGDLSGVWNASSGANFNWDTDEFSGTDLGNIPSNPTDVTFAANGAGNLNTTLGANFGIHNLTFNAPSAVTIGGANTLTINGNVAVNSGSGNHSITAGGVTLGVDQTWTVTDGGTTLSVSSPVNGAKALTIAGSGTVALSGNNSYSGGTLVQAGATLALNNATDTLPNSGAVAVDGGNLNIGANSDTVGVVGLTNGNIVGTSGVLTGSLYHVESGSVSARLGGSAALTKQSVGTVVLSGANTYSGGTTHADGVLQLGNNSALGTGGVNLFGATAILDLNGRSVANVLTASSAGTVANTSASAAALTADVTVSSPFTIDTTGNITTARLVSNNPRAVTKNGVGTLTFNGAGHNNLITLVVNDGAVVFGNVGGFSTDRGTTLNGGAIQLAGPGLGGVAPNANLINDNELFTINGGIFDLNGWNETVAAMGGTGGIVENNLAGTTNSLTVGGNNTTAAWPGVLQNGNGVLGLTKAGTGVQTLSGENTYSGDTIILAGTLALSEPGSITNSGVVDIRNGATLDVTARTDQTLTLASGQTLIGNGGINGNLATSAGSIVNPGASIGTLFVTNNITLAGQLRLEVDRVGAQTSDRLVSVLGTITYGGTLAVTNIGPALQVNDSFQLFPSAVTTFTGIALATTDATGNIYTWNNKVAIDGSIQVASVTPALNPNPTNIVFGVSGNQLDLSWPADHTGWLLQSNAVGLASTGSWFTVAGSSTTNHMVLTRDNSKTNVFFRLLLP